MLHLDFKHHRWEQLLFLLVVLATLMCLFPPEGLLYHWWAEHSIQVAIGLLILGLLNFVLNKYHLMYLCLACSAVIGFSLHKQHGSNSRQDSGFLIDYYFELDTTMLAQRFVREESASCCILNVASNQEPNKAFIPNYLHTLWLEENAGTVFCIGSKWPFSVADSSRGDRLLEMRNGPRASDRFWLWITRIPRSEPALTKVLSRMDFLANLVVSNLIVLCVTDQSDTFYVSDKHLRGNEADGFSDCIRKQLASDKPPALFAFYSSPFDCSRIDTLKNPAGRTIGVGLNCTYFPIKDFYHDNR